MQSAVLLLLLWLLVVAGLLEGCGCCCSCCAVCSGRVGKVKGCREAKWGGVEVKVVLRQLTPAVAGVGRRWWWCRRMWAVRLTAAPSPSPSYVGA